MIQLVSATPSDVAALHAALAPVLANLERDPQPRSFVTAIDAMRNATSATDETPASCAPETQPATSGCPTALHNQHHARRHPVIRATRNPRAGPCSARDMSQSQFTLVFKPSSFVL